MVALAFVFAVVNGANDGSAMLAASLKPQGLRIITAVVVVSAAVAIVPVVLGTRVADTLATGLVAAPQAQAQWLVGFGVTAAMLVVGLLTGAGFPTSLTLGVVGGIVGAGLGCGLPVVWPSVTRVLAFGIAAPVVGALVAQAIARVAPFVGAQNNGWLIAMRRLAFALQAGAYAANDGQKMLAVLAVTASGAVSWTLGAVAILFALGTIVGLPTAARTLGVQVLRSGPREQITAQLSASAAVFGSAALGMPVSMTQAVSGALVGTGLRRGLRRIRWRVAARLALAWLLTLPTAALVGLALALVFGGSS